MICGFVQLGDTPLHAGAWKGRVDVVRLLLERGANVHATNKEVLIRVCGRSSL